MNATTWKDRRIWKMNNLSLSNNPDDKGDEECPDMINSVDDGLVIEENFLISNQKHNVIDR